MGADDPAAGEAVVDELVLGRLALAEVPAVLHDHVLGLAVVRVHGDVLGLALALLLLLLKLLLLLLFLVLLTAFPAFRRLRVGRGGLGRLGDVLLGLLGLLVDLVEGNRNNLVLV